MKRLPGARITTARTENLRRRRRTAAQKGARERRERERTGNGRINWIGYDRERSDWEWDPLNGSCPGSKRPAPSNKQNEKITPIIHLNMINVFILKELPTIPVHMAQ